MFRLIATYFRLGALNELQYRANFWVNLLQSTLSLLSALAFAVTVPAEAIVGRLSWTSLFASLTLAAAIFIAARAFWRYGVRNYSRASA